MQGTPVDEKLRCARCGDVIGAYEPLVVLDHGRALDTSKAEMLDGIPPGACYHGACYTQARGHTEDGSPAIRGNPHPLRWSTADDLPAGS